MPNSYDTPEICVSASLGDVTPLQVPSGETLPQDFGYMWCSLSHMRIPTESCCGKGAGEDHWRTRIRVCWDKDEVGYVTDVPAGVTHGTSELVFSLFLVF